MRAAWHTLFIDGNVFFTITLYGLLANQAM